MNRPIKFRKPDGSTFTIDEPDVKQLVGYDSDGNEVYEGDIFIVPCGTEIAARFIDNLTPNAKLKEAHK